jgi:outer membrane protein TolC
MAWENRKSIASSRLDLPIRKLQTDALFRKYWPQLSLEYLYQFNPILQTSILPIGIFNPTYPPGATQAVQFGTKWSQNAGITLMQPLLDLSIGRQIREYKLQEEISKHSEDQLEYQLAYDVAQAYQNISLQEGQIQLAIQDTNRTWISLNLQKNEFAFKRLLKSELNTAQINHDNAVQKWKDAISLLIENKVFILFLTGQNSLENTDFQIDENRFSDDQFFNTEFPQNPDSIPEIQGLELQKNLPELQIRSERSKYLPTISLKGFLGANQYTNNFNPVQAGTWFGNSYLGVDVKLPILNGEDKSKTIKEYRFQSEQFRNQKEEKLAAYSKDALTAKIRILRIKDQLKNFQKTIELSKETIKIIQDRVEQGQETVTQLNTQESNLQALEANYTLAKKQGWAYYLDYLKASGLLKSLWKD